jgi:hypothetical protein
MSKPRNPDQIRLKMPSPLSVPLRRPEVSASEALTIIEPLIVGIDPPRFLAGLTGEGSISLEGYPRIGVGCWSATFCVPNRAELDLLRVNLFPKGAEARVAFRRQMIPASIADSSPPVVALGDDWLDSTDIAAIVARDAVLPEEGTSPSLFMRLQPYPPLPLCWEVMRTSTPAPRQLVQLTWAIRSDSGNVLWQKFERRVGSEIVESWSRRRAALE